MIKANISPNGEISIESVVVSDSVNFVAISFDFPPSWDGLTKTVVFSNAGKTVNVILDDTNSCHIPYEVNFEPEFTVSVFGVKDGVRATTARGTVKVLESGYLLGDAPKEPTLTEYEQIVSLMNETKQIAQSVRDDADSGAFKGDKGDTGPQGEKGEPFVYSDFTVEQLENLRGPQGPQGEKGDTGLQGENYILTDADKQEIAGMVEVGNTPTSDNWCVIANTTLTENIGSVTPFQKLCEFTTDINGNPLSQKNIRHLRMHFYFPKSEDAIYNTFSTTVTPNGKDVGGIQCAEDRYYSCSIDVMNEKRAYVTRPLSPLSYYSSGNLYIDVGADKDNLFGGKDKIEYIAFFTNYPNGTILPVGTKIMITGW